MLTEKVKQTRPDKVKASLQIVEKRQRAIWR